MYPDAVILNQDFVFWAMNAPEVLELLLEENPNFAEDFVKQPPISSGSAIILSRFHHDNILLIGDAAHSMVCLQDLRHIYSCQNCISSVPQRQKTSAWNI
jgi:sulfur transfer complex TusBCD TusB component (DsrH family)